MKSFFQLVSIGVQHYVKVTREMNRRYAQKSGVSKMFVQTQEESTMDTREGKAQLKGLP